MDSIRVKRKMGIGQGMGSSIIMKVENTGAIGSIIKCMERESYNMLMAELLMRANGMQISFMATEFYIMKHLATQTGC